MLTIGFRRLRLHQALLCRGVTSSSESSIRTRLLERNAAWRERSEAALNESRSNLETDIRSHSGGMNEIRNVIREATVVIQPPPVALYDSTSAFYFPELEVCSLGGETVHLKAGGSSYGRGLFVERWTLLGCSGSHFSQAVVDEWLLGSSDLGNQDEHSTLKPDLQVLWLSMVEGAVLSWLRRPLLASMRASVPVERHNSFLCYFGDSQKVRKRMKMDNRFLGYMCLVDPKGAVRWHIHGNKSPTPDELAALRALILRAMQAKHGTSRRRAR